MKIAYGTADASDGSKTFSNMNPEASNENLVTTAEKLTALQDKTMLQVQRIDTDIIFG